jgi:hypothetical protein
MLACPFPVLLLFFQLVSCAGHTPAQGIALDQAASSCPLPAPCAVITRPHTHPTHPTPAHPPTHPPTCAAGASAAGAAGAGLHLCSSAGKGLSSGLRHAGEGGHSRLAAHTGQFRACFRSTPQHAQRSSGCSNNAQAQRHAQVGHHRQAPHPPTLAVAVAAAVAAALASPPPQTLATALATASAVAEDS